MQSSLAKNIYEAVDRRIIQTDADIRRFEAELDRERKKYGLKTSKVVVTLRLHLLGCNMRLLCVVILDKERKTYGLKTGEVDVTLQRLSGDSTSWPRFILQACGHAWPSGAEGESSYGQLVGARHTASEANVLNYAGAGSKR